MTETLNQTGKLVKTKLRAMKTGELSEKVYMNEQEVAAMTGIAVSTLRNDRVKRGRLKALIDVRLYHVVKELRSKGVSWRESAKYLKTYHKTQISHVHLHKLYLKIMAERIKREEE